MPCLVQGMRAKSEKLEVKRWRNEQAEVKKSESIEFDYCVST